MSGPTLAMRVCVADIKSSWVDLTTIGCADTYQYKFPYVIRPRRQKSAIVDLDDIVERSPQGAETQFGRLFDTGVDLSLGQWQRLQRAPVLLLDEPTAFVDRDTATHLRDGLSALDDRIIILVTHWAGLAASCDRVVVLQDGRIAEVGKPSELGSEDTIFARMLDEERGVRA